MLYLIELQKNKISLSEYDSDSKNFTKIKKNGEVWQEFVPREFWQWFQKKVEYDDEKLSFAIISDSETFVIDETIELSKINFVEDKQNIFQLLLNEINQTQKLLFIPHFDYITPKKQMKTTPKKPIKKESLSEYYANKTKLLRGK